MGWYNTCVDEVKKMIPPQKMCDYNRCLRIQNQIDAACHSRHWEPGSPYVLDNPDGSVCYCCCSCFAQNTPIEISPRVFKLVQDFRNNDKVYAATADLQWKEVVVDFCTNIAGAETDSFMVNIEWGTNPVNRIVVTEDHLFLLPGKLLAPAGSLNVNDMLIAPDGSPVKITRITSGMQKGGVYQIATGEPKETIDGHLLNSNGVVSADFAVQAGYIGGQLDKKFLIPDLDKRLRVGSREYQDKYYDNETLKYIASPDMWPKGFTIFSRHNLYVIPPEAKSFITNKQAEDIMNNEKAEQRPFNSNYGIEMAEYLWKYFKSFYPGINYVMDWNNSLPNAYTWNLYGQIYLLLTGGLIRQSSLNKEGLSIILSQGLSYCNIDETSEPVTCTGQADYQSVIYLGNIYRDKNFIQTFRDGMLQIQLLWSYISPENREPGKSKCKNPGIKCRIDTFNAAAYMEPIPPCADINYVPFEVTGASSKKGDGTVKVDFNFELNENTATSVINYSITPYVEILDAKMGQKLTSVILSAAANIDQQYILQVRNVISDKGYVLDKDHSQVTFTVKD
ncbi:MAG TPA: Hint domain-containing protein [Chitinophagaceae bacterium]